ncbi:MAG: chymotrypsin family serine protease [Candidatus Amoebophilus sp.]
MEEKSNKQLFLISGVVGFGHGFKEVNGERTNEEALLILVQKKLPPDKIPQDQLIPKLIDGRKTDVIEVGHIKTHNFTQEVPQIADPLVMDLYDLPVSDIVRKHDISPDLNTILTLNRVSKVRPAPPGVGIGHYLVSAGTFGAIVYESNGQPLILSNNHILANSSTSRYKRARIGDPVLQPAVYDGGRNSSNIIARLYKYVALANYPEANHMDCALAKPLRDDMIDPNILEIGKVLGVIPPLLGMAVKKSGRSSGVTTGEIRAINVNINVDYGQGMVLRFENQILTTPMSAPGDSGSLVLDLNNRATGLLFAGSEKSTVINPIQEILNIFNVKFEA